MAEVMCPICEKMHPVLTRMVSKKYKGRDISYVLEYMVCPTNPAYEIQTGKMMDRTLINARIAMRVVDLEEWENG